MATPLRELMLRGLEEYGAGSSFSMGMSSAKKPEPEKPEEKKPKVLHEGPIPDVSKLPDFHNSSTGMPDAYKLDEYFAYKREIENSIGKKLLGEDYDALDNDLDLIPSGNRTNAKNPMQDFYGTINDIMPWLGSEPDEKTFSEFINWAGGNTKKQFSKKDFRTAKDTFQNLIEASGKVLRKGTEEGKINIEDVTPEDLIKKAGFPKHFEKIKIWDNGWGWAGRSKDPIYENLESKLNSHEGGTFKDVLQTVIDFNARQETNRLGMPFEYGMPDKFKQQIKSRRKEMSQQKVYDEELKGFYEGLE